ncbi:HPP [Bartonella apihabitans]
MSDLTDASKSQMTLFLTSKAPARPSSLQILTGFAGGMVSISILAFMAGHYHIPLIMAPFGATCVLLYALPESPLAQPRSVIDRRSSSFDIRRLGCFPPDRSRVLGNGSCCRFGYRSHAVHQNHSRSRRCRSNSRIFGGWSRLVISIRTCFPWLCRSCCYCIRCEQHRSG